MLSRFPTARRSPKTSEFVHPSLTPTRSICCRNTDNRNSSTGDQSAMILIVAGRLLITSSVVAQPKVQSLHQDTVRNACSGPQLDGIVGMTKAWQFFIQKEIGADEENAIPMIVWKKGTSWEDQATQSRALGRSKTLTCCVSKYWSRERQWCNSCPIHRPCSLTSYCAIFCPTPKPDIKHGNSFAHTARLTKDFLEQNTCNARVNPWPALSPDLNPIEQLRSEV